MNFQFSTRSSYPFRLLSRRAAFIDLLAKIPFSRDPPPRKHDFIIQISCRLRVHVGKLAVGQGRVKKNSSGWWCEWKSQRGWFRTVSGVNVAFNRMDRGEGVLGDYSSMSKRVHTMHVEIRPHLSLLYGHVKIGILG